MGRGHGFKSTWANEKYCKPKKEEGTGGSTGGGGGEGIGDAPSNGIRYVRRNGRWEAIPYATKQDAIELESEEKILSPKALGELLEDMGVSKDEGEGGWTMDQGELP